ncbi:uncharacterized protein TNCV_602251 [Trichonephila clavipes]|nr:uncharacterized protein TNCV_602251 [Trichonephila clavipes]
MSETEKAQMTEIRAARVRVKASLTRLENTFDEINTRNEISIRLSSLDDLLKEFERLDSTLSLEESEIHEFEERYFYLNAKFNDKFDELNARNQGLLTNEPFSLIKQIPISNDSYEETWLKLLDRYDNKKQIVLSLIKTFLDQKPISEANCYSFRNLLDVSGERLRGLYALVEQTSSKDCWLIYLLLQKIDSESRRLWAIKSSEEEFPNMKAFLDFLNVRCSSFELMLNNESLNVKFRNGINMQILILKMTRS